MNCPLWVSLGLLTLTVLGCAGLGGRFAPPPLAPEVEAVISQLSQRNSGLETFKASGRVEMHHKGQFKVNQTALWAGEGSAKMRLTLLGIDGRPLTSIVRDGQWLHLLFHPQDRLEKVKVGESGLRRITQIEFSPDALASLLMGKIPLEKFTRADLSPTAAGGRVLSLDGGWGSAHQRIYFSVDPLQVSRIEAYSAAENLRYRVDLSPPRSQDGYQVPTRIEIRNGQDDRLRVEIERYWPNAPLPAGIFSLKPALPSRGAQG